MTFPAVVFSFFIAMMFGSLLHLWRGGSLGRLVLYLVFSLIGFFGGHFLAGMLGIEFLDLGTIHLGMGILGSLLLLALVYWLSLVDLENA
ncbi:MAG TPA: hypothetical protein DCL08_09130 [Anaerolineaceae bacterium]|jgi:hypothetical protein|nr:MAG: putative membrane protein [Anaerolineaceae bacterium 46_22]HAF49380.1 hypothetical protein [Anaerolineaceae bacterium]